MPAAPAATDITDDRAHRMRWWTLAVLCLSLLIVFVGNSSLNVAIPTLVARAARDGVAVAVGRRDLLARLRGTAVLDRGDRRPLRSQGRAPVRPACCSSSARASRRRRPRCGRSSVAGRSWARPARSSCRRRCRSSSTSSHRNERPKAIAIWASFTGASARSGRSQAATCSATSGSDRCSSSTCRSS